jgi:Surfeit locus protein 5 subunit 22 of Mediator complex
MVSADVLLDREQTLIDALLLRFRSMVELVTIPDGEVTKEAAAAQSFQMQVETAALVCTYLGSIIHVALALTL